MISAGYEIGGTALAVASIVGKTVKVLRCCLLVTFDNMLLQSNNSATAHENPGRVSKRSNMALSP